MELTLKLMYGITLRLKPAMDPTLTCGQRMRLFIHVVFDVGSENVNLCRLAHLGVDAQYSDVLEHRPDGTGVHRQWGDDAHQLRFRLQFVDAFDVWRPTSGVLLQPRIRCWTSGCSRTLGCRLGIVRGLAAASAEMVGYFLGYKGQSFVCERRMCARMQSMTAKYGDRAIFFAGIPGPFDIAGL